MKHVIAKSAEDLSKAVIAGPVLAYFADHEDDLMEWEIEWRSYQLVIKQYNTTTDMRATIEVEAYEAEDVEAWARRIWPTIRGLELWVD